MRSLKFVLAALAVTLGAGSSASAEPVKLSKEQMATITAGGLATGAAPGTSQISATSAGVTGSTTLTVGPAALVSIAVTPANQTVKIGMQVFANGQVQFGGAFPTDTLPCEGRG